MKSSRRIEIEIGASNRVTKRARTLGGITRALRNAQGACAVVVDGREIYAGPVVHWTADVWADLVAAELGQ